jgi:hypothetical protein
MSKNNEEDSGFDKSFGTGRRAELILQGLLPAGWFWRVQSPDRHVDFVVETDDHGKPTGLQFCLQIKGRSKVALKKSKLSLRMETKHLDYYRNKARLPVFIALVDVNAGKACWVFAQKYLAEKPSGSAVKPKKSFTLKIDPTDSFSDLGRFRDALQAAERYMRDLYPGTPKAAVLNQKKELQSLDPDIDVNISFEEKLTFTSKEPISLQLRGRGAEQWKAYLAMLDHGDDFNAELEVIPPESPLFRKLMPSGKRLIKFTPRSFSGCVQIICGTSTQTIIQIPGEWRGGRKSVRFQGALQKSPLSVELQLSDFLEKASSAMSFSTPLRLSAWEGELISCLPWLQEIRAFLAALSHGEPFVLNYFINGLKLGGCEAVANPGQETLGLKEEVEWLSRAQTVADHYGLLIRLPSLTSISSRTEDDVEALWGLVTGNVIEHSIAGIRFTIRTEPNASLPSASAEVGKPICGVMKLVGIASFDFFGHLIEVPNTEQIFTRMELVDCESDPTSGHLTFQGKEEATLTRRKVA